MAPPPIPDLELTLAADGTGSYGLDLRFLPPESDVVQHFQSTQPVTFDLDALTLHLDDDEGYGDLLGGMLFADPNALSFFDKSRSVAHATGHPLRVRLAIRANAAALHGIQWERLRVPGGDGFLARSERVLFSRYLSTTDSRPHQPRKPAEIRGLIAVANPTNLADYGLAEIDVDAEIARAKQGFGDTTVDALNDTSRATMDALVDRLRDGYDVLYLVCHGTLQEATPWLWLEQADGTLERVSGTEFVTRIAGLPTPPRLMVLASCVSAGEGTVGREGALAALGPSLAQAGIPAVVAMQGNVSRATVAAFMPVLFRELRRDGRIDRAMAAARGAVQGAAGWWTPVLTMNSRSGLLFAEEEELARATKEITVSGSGAVATDGGVAAGAGGTAIRDIYGPVTFMAPGTASAKDDDDAPAPGDPPYKGLYYFDVGDADRFFGREALTGELVEYLRAHRFLAVIGASGSGKSSLVRAGVVAAIQTGKGIDGSERWSVHIVTPTAHPLKTLAASLTKESESVTAQATFMDDLGKEPRSLDLYASRIVAKSPGDRLLLVVDQFEELFTLCRDKDERAAFVDNLLTAATDDGVTAAVITLRADFYHRCAEFDELRTALESYQRYIGAMSEDELRDAIVKPAENGDWHFESGLVDVMLGDAVNEPGALPLLSHALLETWARRRGRTMTFEGYHAAGGVKGAIATRADAEFAKLTPEKQTIARSIFVRLTELGEGSEDTRRRVVRQQLLTTGKDVETVESVLATLGYARLITADEDEVEVAHEALIREWPRLREWLNEDRDGLRLHHRLSEAAEEWARAGRNPDDLWRGTRLDQASEWATTNPASLNDLEREFLHLSTERVEAETRAQEEARDRELKAAQDLAAAEEEARRQAEARLAAESESLAAAQTAQRAEGEARLVAETSAKRLRNRAVYLGIALAVALLAVGVTIYFFSLAQQQLVQLEGERKLTEAYQAMEALDVDGAISLWEDAVAAQPILMQRVGVSTFPTDTRRYVATQWVQQGEALLREVRDADSEELKQTAALSATKLFTDALALNPPPDTPVYVWIEGGEFEMGSEDGDSNERPVHTVSLDGFWIMRTEMTNSQYGRCVSAGACEPPDNSFWDHPQNTDDPVTYVDWDRASAYAAWVGGRLPTEAEWEYACRSSEGYIYPWGNEPPDADRANYWPHVNNVTRVGSYPPGVNGLYDMAGNVREYTADWYDESYYATSPTENPQGPDDGDWRVRVLRGGSFFDAEDDVRCAARGPDLPAFLVGSLGFRVVAAPIPLASEASGD